MMGVAAGLATMGYVPFVSSFAMFAAGRAFEQIRNSIAYPRLNVKIGATHGASTSHGHDATQTPQPLQRSLSTTIVPFIFAIMAF